MDSPFMRTVARDLADSGLKVIRFNFNYMNAAVESGRRGRPDSTESLLQQWRDVFREVRGSSSGVAIGGKSMGGRMATMVADELEAAAVVCLGYPFHPPGRPEKVRTAHLEAMRTRTLIVQGTRDSFGTPGDVQGYALSPQIEMAWIEDGDHSLKPRKSSGRTERENIDEAVSVITKFLDAGNSADPGRRRRRDAGSHRR